MEKHSTTLISLVEKHLMTKKKITSKEAFELYGATRLSDIVGKLRKRGYPITTKRVEGVNRYGNSVHYGVYTIPPKWSKKSLDRKD